MRRHTDAPAALTVSRCALPRPHVLLLVLHRCYRVGKLRNLSLQGRDVLCTEGGTTLQLELSLRVQAFDAPCFAMSWKRSSPVWIENATSFSVICSGCGKNTCCLAGTALSPENPPTNRAHPIAKAHAVQARRGRNDGEVPLLLSNNRVVRLAIGANNNGINVKDAPRDDLEGASQLVARRYLLVKALR